MNIQLLKKRLVWQTILLIAIDALFFGTINPQTANSLFLIAGFVLLGLNVYVLVKVILIFLTKLGFKIRNKGKIAAFCVILSILLLALQSIGQLSARDVLIIVPLTVILYIYTAFVRPRNLE